MPTDLSPLLDEDVIRVRDRSDFELPFSRGIMATSLLATGVPTHEAYSVAKQIARTLKQEGVREVGADELAGIAADELANGPGEVFAQRYRAWRYAKQLGRPLVVCLSGVSGVGKSTIATRLALRLGINRVLTTDAIREVLRTVIPTAVLPELHVSSFERVPAALAGDADGFALQMRAVSAACTAVAQRLVTEGRNVILEGVHLEPGAVQRELRARGEKAIVVERLLTLDDEGVHAARLDKRRRDQPGRKGARHLRHLPDIRDLQARLRDVAGQRGVPEHDILHPEDLTQSVVDEVTGILHTHPQPALAVTT